MWIKNSICFVSLLSFYFISAAQQDSFLLKGFIYTENKEPVSGAYIYLPAQKITRYANHEGFFEIYLPVNKVTITISAMNYKKLSVEINVPDKDNVYTFFLIPDTTTMEDVSIFSYSATQLANRQAYNVTAIDAKKLHNSTLDIAHILDRVPGARLRETGGVGSDFDFSINGFSGKRVKFFLDGVPMDNFGSSFQINNIPVNFAERIEVYKGVVPVWLGSDALGGAVNIITNDKMRNYLDVSYSYGSFNTHRSYMNTGYTAKNGFTVRLNAFQNYSDNDYKITIDAADIRTGKYYPNTTVRRFHDKYHNETAIAQIGFVDKKWADHLLAGITVGKYYKQIQTGATIDNVFGAWHQKGNIVMPTLEYKKSDLFVNGLDVIVNANYNMGQEQNIDTLHARFGWLGDSITHRGKGGELWYSYYKYRDNNANAIATVIYKLGEKQTIAVNNTFGHFNRKGTNVVSADSRIDNIPQKINKNILGISYQYKSFKKWDATIFGKYYSQKGNTEVIDIDYTREEDTTFVKESSSRNKLGYGLAASYFATDALQVKLSYEKTNRLPESDELFGDVAYQEGNWSLRPESSNNINLGISYSQIAANHRFYIGSTGIYRYAKDFVYQTFNALENKIIAQNLLKVSSVGIESEIRYSYRKLLSAGINATYQNLRDNEKYMANFNCALSSTYKERIPNIPYLYGNADATLYFNDVLYKSDRLTFGYNLLYVHSFYLYWESQGAKETKRTIPKQISHDANIVYTLKDGRYNIGIECRNVTNVKLYDNFSLQKPGRAFNIKLRYFINR